MAKASLVLGAAGFLCGASRAPILVLLGIPAGVMAFICGLVAIGLIYRRPNMVRGNGFAIGGICLGLVGALMSAAGVERLFAQRLPSDPRGQEESSQGQRPSPRSVLRSQPITNFTSNLPIVVLETDGKPVSKDERTLVRSKFYEPRDGRASLASEPHYDGLGTINLRGHSTMELPKRSYTFHTVNERGEQIKAPLLGMAAEEDWILYAPYEDKSLIRDVLAYELARRMGHYAPRTRYVELFVARRTGAVSMRDYQGVYVLIERIKRGKDRVNIAKLEPEVRSEPDISGGYIIKRDHGEGGGGRFRTERGGPYFYVYPKPRDITSEQKTWLRNYFTAFERSLYSDNFQDPKRGYAAYLDVGGFIDAHWLIELSKNVDGFRYSAYLTKDRNGKLKPGPAWDWNRAFGNANYYGGQSTKGWYWSVLRPNEISWHQRLREDPAYVKRAASRWTELRRDILASEKVGALIDQLALHLEESQRRNFQRWSILGEHVASNNFVGQTYAEEVAWLKKWVERRMDWMDTQIDEGKL